ncbi:hypothetical protein [Ideonella sp. BN130291]|uniref:hypothetical protein n=1 Tax=Ideonella sp. BN130291 TaxID=3112940 RepID=UPI002E252580|nr:hypothetical protein [Ideonella sp. BN130291]
MKSTRGLVWLAGLAGLLAGISLSTHRRREAERRTLRVKPEPLQTWEGEGGAVPLRTGRTAQQVTPSSAQAQAGEPFSGQGPLEQGGGPRYEQGGPPR